MSIPEHMHVSEGPQRFDVFTGGGRRRRFTAAEKAAIVDESYADGTSVCGVARRHGLTSQQLFGWRRLARLGPSSSLPAERPLFVPVIVASEPEAPPRDEAPTGPKPRRRRKRIEEASIEVETNDGQRSALKALFEKHPALGTAYRLREAFYDLYEIGTRAEAEREMTAWLAAVKAAPTLKTKTASYGMDRIFKQLVTAIGGWRPYMLNYFDHPFTNAYVESLNRLIGQINATAAGLDYDLIRAKAMLRYSRLREEPVYKLRKKREKERGPMDMGFMTAMRDHEEVQVGTRLVHSGVPLSTLETLIEDEAIDLVFSPE